MAKKNYHVWTLTFFGASSSNFFDKGLPYKILMFLSLVLVALSNDTTFEDKIKGYCLPYNYQKVLILKNHNFLTNKARKTWSVPF